MVNFILKYHEKITKHRLPKRISGGTEDYLEADSGDAKYYSIKRDVPTRDLEAVLEGAAEDLGYKEIKKTLILERIQLPKRAIYAPSLEFDINKAAGGLEIRSFIYSGLEVDTFFISEKGKLQTSDVDAYIQKVRDLILSNYRS